MGMTAQRIRPGSNVIAWRNEVALLEPQLRRNALWRLALLHGRSVLHADADGKLGPRLHCLGQSCQHPLSQTREGKSEGRVSLDRCATRRDSRKAQASGEVRADIHRGGER